MKPIGEDHSSKPTIWLPLAVLLFLSLCILSYHCIRLTGRIDRALELLSSDNDEILKPAKLYSVLSGIQFTPIPALDQTDSDQKKNDKAKLKALPNNGVPVR